MPEVKRPLAISVVAILTFILGISGAALALIRIGAVSYPPFTHFFSFFFILGLVMFSLLALAGHNLWKMKKWAAKLAVIVYLLDLVITPFTGLLHPFSFVAGGSIIVMAIDIIFLAVIASAWKEFQ